MRTLDFIMECVDLVGFKCFEYALVSGCIAILRLLYCLFICDETLHIVGLHDPIFTVPLGAFGLFFMFGLIGFITYEILRTFYKRLV